MTSHNREFRGFHRIRVPKISLLMALFKIKSYIREAAASVGYPALKPEQEEAITQFLMGRDVFVALAHRLWEESVVLLSPARV